MIMWSNLLSGVIGAAVGGVLTLGASVITMRQQRQLASEARNEDRRQEQLRASHTAGAQILVKMLTIKQGLWDVQKALESKKDPPLGAVYAAAESVLVVHNSQIACKDLRSRINELCKLLEMWYLDTYRSPDPVLNRKRIDTLNPYMEYMRQSIQAHLDEQQQLPSYECPPDLLIPERNP